MKSLNQATRTLILKSLSTCINPDQFLFLSANDHPAGLEDHFYKDGLPDSAFFRPKTYLDSGK